MVSKKHSSAQKSVVSAKKKESSGLGQSLVGSRVRVYWPIDRKFYEGVVDSFDSRKRKHLVLYDDGDREKLDMAKERYEVVAAKEDSEAEEISNEEDSDNESSDASPEPPSRKRTRSNGRVSANGKRGKAAPKRQKVDSSAISKSKAKTKVVKKQTSKTVGERNGNLGNIGGKIIAAASRMSGRAQRKPNGQEKETTRSLRSGKKITVSKAVSKKVKKPRTSAKQIKSSNSDDDASDDDAEMSDEEAGASEEASEEEANGEEADDEEGDSEEADDEEAPEDASEEATGEDEANGDDDVSDDESKPLLNLLKETPVVMEALKKKMKRKKKEAREESSEDEEEEAEEEEEEEESS